MVYAGCVMCVILHVVVLRRRQTGYLTSIFPQILPFFYIFAFISTFSRVTSPVWATLPYLLSLKMLVLC